MWRKGACRGQAVVVFSSLREARAFSIPVHVGEREAQDRCVTPGERQSFRGPGLSVLTHSLPGPVLEPGQKPQIRHKSKLTDQPGGGSYDSDDNSKILSAALQAVAMESYLVLTATLGRTKFHRGENQGREQVKGLGQGHVTSKWWSWVL